MPLQTNRICFCQGGLERDSAFNIGVKAPRWACCIRDSRVSPAAHVLRRGTHGKVWGPVGGHSTHGGSSCFLCPAPRWSWCHRLFSAGARSCGELRGERWPLLSEEKETKTFSFSGHLLFTQVRTRQKLWSQLTFLPTLFSRQDQQQTGPARTGRVSLPRLQTQAGGSRDPPAVLWLRLCHVHTLKRKTLLLAFGTFFPDCGGTHFAFWKNSIVVGSGWSGSF